MFQVSCKGLGNILVNKIVLGLVKLMFCWKGGGHRSMNQYSSWEYFLIFIVTMETTAPSRKGNPGFGICFDHNL